MRGWLLAGCRIKSDSGDATSQSDSRSQNKLIEYLYLSLSLTFKSKLGSIVKKKKEKKSFDRNLFLTVEPINFYFYKKKNKLRDRIKWKENFLIEVEKQVGIRVDKSGNLLILRYFAREDRRDSFQRVAETRAPRTDTMP